jgi:endonuclease
MPMYEKPVRVLMRDMVEELVCQKEKIVSKDQVLNWFAEKYPKIKQGTISAHLIRFSTNAPSRLHYSARPGEEDLLFQIDGSHFRRFDPATDPAPIHEVSQASQNYKPADGEEAEPEGSNEFAYEADLRDFLARNLPLLERGLRLYEDEGITGVEFPVGGRFVDILAVTPEKDYVVIELKVSRGYDRVVGQLLRYMAWIAKNHAEAQQKVRGIIIAREITPDLLLACSGLPNVELFEYQLSVSLRKVSA